MSENVINICNFIKLVFYEVIKVFFFCYLTFDINQSIIVRSDIANSELKETCYLQGHIQGKCHYSWC